MRENVIKGKIILEHKIINGIARNGFAFFVSDGMNKRLKSKLFGSK